MNVPRRQPRPPVLRTGPGGLAYGSANGTFTVTYANGNKTTANVTFADWVDNAPAGRTDFLATTGVDVQSELNPTLGPVVLQGVTVPWRARAPCWRRPQDGPNLRCGRGGPCG